MKGIALTTAFAQDRSNERGRPRWVDTEVITDDQFVTSCKPDDLPAFNREMIQLFSGTREVAALKETA